MKNLNFADMEVRVAAQLEGPVVEDLGMTIPKGFLQNDNDCWIDGGVL